MTSVAHRRTSAADPEPNPKGRTMEPGESSTAPISEPGGNGDNHVARLRSVASLGLPSLSEFPDTSPIRQHLALSDPSAAAAQRGELSPDGRSRMAVGYAFASQIIAAALVVAAPILLGALIDGWAGSSPAGVLVGTFLGLLFGALEVAKLARQITAAGFNQPSRPAASTHRSTDASRSADTGPPDLSRSGGGKRP